MNQRALLKDCCCWQSARVIKCHPPRRPLLSSHHIAARRLLPPRCRRITAMRSCSKTYFSFFLSFSSAVPAHTPEVTVCPLNFIRNFALKCFIRPARLLGWTTHSQSIQQLRGLCGEFIGLISLYFPFPTVYFHMAKAIGFISLLLLLTVQTLLDFPVWRLYWSLTGCFHLFLSGCRNGTVRLTTKRTKL